MAATAHSPRPRHPVFLFFLVSCAVLSSGMLASALEFRVGGERGWVKPTGNETETYNHWAGRNRFHIGDTIYFKYDNDTLLIVNRPEYANCNTTSPILTFKDGNTTYTFQRYGYFYFISGNPDNCAAGQKLIIRVMVHPEYALNPAGSPGYAPAMAPSNVGEGYGGSYGGYNAPAGAPGTTASPSSAGKIRLVGGLVGVVLLIISASFFLSFV